MKYYIIAGEASGDLHGSNLVGELQQLDKSASFKGVGGDKLIESGVDTLIGLDRLAFMGFYEVLKNLRIVIQNFKIIKNDILKFQPDVIILIDYPGFNLRMAKWAKLQGFKVVYFISPQIWAWKANRVEIIKKYVDMMLCLLPFEKDFYIKHQYTKAYFIGHPLLDRIDLVSNQMQPNKNAIALLPGSRQQEINHLLPVMIATANYFPDEKFIITAITRLKNLYPENLPENVTIEYDRTYEVLKSSKAAIVCSGTATLEAALFQVPQVVVYKTSWLNYHIGKRLAKVDFISLPNLIANKKVVEELLQYDCNVKNVTAELQKLLANPSDEFYGPLNKEIGQKGATVKAAKIIADFLQIA